MQDTLRTHLPGRTINQSKLIALSTHKPLAMWREARKREGEIHWREERESRMQVYSSVVLTKWTKWCALEPKLELQMQLFSRVILSLVNTVKWSLDLLLPHTQPAMRVAIVVILACLLFLLTIDSVDSARKGGSRRRGKQKQKQKNWPRLMPMSPKLKAYYDNENVSSIIITITIFINILNY